MNEYNASALRLFKTIVSDKELNKIPNREALYYGLVIDSSIEKDVVDEAIKQYGIDIFGVNSTLHKSFNKVRNASFEELVVEQLFHYFSTYGTNFEGKMYLPKEELDIDVLHSTQFMAINVVSSFEQLYDRIIGLLDGVALSQQTSEDLTVLIDSLSKESIKKIVNNSKNKEVNIRLCHEFGLVPKNGDEFVRYLIFMATEQTLKIKSKEVLCAMESYNVNYFNAFKKYINTYKSLIPLAESFNRNKEFYMTIKSVDKKSRRIINKISKLSKKHHIPMKTDNSIKHVVDAGSLDFNCLSVFDMTKACNYFNYKSKNYDYNGYAIRNGKRFYKENTVKSQEDVVRNRNIIFNELKNKIKNNLIYIPSGMNYPIPTSEKQFIGNVPNYTTIELPKDKCFLIGVHWTTHADIDFSMRNPRTGCSISWDEHYRSENGTILFSGDMTDTIDGHASEVFYIEDAEDINGFMAEVNLFSLQYGEDVKFDFFIALSDKRTALDKNCAVDPNDIIFMVKDIDLSNRSFHIGDFTTTKYGNLVFVLNAENKKAKRVSSLDEVSKMAQYVADKKAETILTFRDVFNVLDEKMKETLDDNDVSYVDLSPKEITKDTLLNLLK